MPNAPTEKPAGVEKNCTDCGKSVRKFTRIHKEKGYCANCYKRLFVREICPRCRNFKRILKTDNTSICVDCFSSLPCIRCKRDGRSVGLLTATGPVCNSCAPHFREPVPCEACSTKTVRISRVEQNGQALRVCQSCANKAHRTCTSCRRHRQIAFEEGRIQLCKRCHTLPPGTCPNCSASMPAGRLKECEDCYWRSLLQKRLALLKVGLKSKVLRQDLEEFAGWIAEKSGPATAAIKLKQCFPLFIEIGEKWDSFPSYEELIAHLGSAAVSRHLLLFRWLRKSGRVTENKEFRTAETERQLVSRLLEEFIDKSDAGALIRTYHGHLIESRPRKPRSIRLALSPAAAFLKFAGGKSRETMTQQNLDRFLLEKPGQRAALTGFVNFLRREFKFALSIKRQKPVVRLRAKRRMLERPIIEAIAVGIDDPARLNRWISLSLAYFHNLPKNASAIIDQRDIREENDGFEVTWRDQKYWVPKP
jgi:hypothetical protein